MAEAEGRAAGARFDLVVVPLVAALLFAVAQTQWTGRHRTLYVLIGVSVAKLAASGGFGLATLRFRRGEYLYWAWLLLALHMLPLAFKDLLFGRLVHLPQLSAAQCSDLRQACSILGNVLFVIAMVLLARVWRVAGFALPGSATSRVVWTLVAFAIAVAIVGYGSIENFRRFAHGDGEALVSLASNAGDIICFTLTAPLVFIALALRGGMLAWPWGLLVSSELGWLVFDLFYAAHNAHPLGRHWMLVTAESMRVLACLFAAAAGLAQRRAVVERRGGTPISGVHALPEAPAP